MDIDLNAVGIPDMFRYALLTLMEMKQFSNDETWKEILIEYEEILDHMMMYAAKEQG